MRPGRWHWSLNTLESRLYPYSRIHAASRNGNDLAVSYNQLVGTDNEHVVLRPRVVRKGREDVLNLLVNAALAGLRIQSGRPYRPCNKSQLPLC